MARKAATNRMPIVTSKPQSCGGMHLSVFEYQEHLRKPLEKTSSIIPRISLMNHFGVL